MSANSISGSSSANSSAQTNEATSLYSLKKAQDVQKQTASQLIQALPQPTPSNPPNLGTVVDTRA